MEDWHLRFGITSNCNFRCKYCNSHNSHSKDMSDKDIKEILEAAIENGVKKIHWTGGEPLFKTTITEFMKYANDTLLRVSNRENSTHYFMKEADYTDQYYTGRVEVSNQDYLGQVISYDKMTKLLKFYERNYFEVGDTVEVFTPNGDSMIFDVSKLYDSSKGEILVARHPDDIYYLYVDAHFEIGEYSMFRLIKKGSDRK